MGQSPPQNETQYIAVCKHCGQKNRVTSSAVDQQVCGKCRNPIIEQEELPQSQSLNHYEVLQVSPSASAEIIALVYRHIAKQIHPDTAPSHLKSEREELLKKVNEAYFVLSDKDKRASYDTDLEYDTGSGGGIHPLLLQFEMAAVLAEAAVEGGGKDLCFNKSATILKGIAEETAGTEYGFEALVRLFDVQYNGLKAFSDAADTVEKILPQMSPGEDRDECLLLAIDCHAKLHSWEATLHCSDRAISECSLPNTMMLGRLNRAGSFAGLRRFDEALEGYNLITRVYGSATEAAYSQFMIGRILDSELQRYKEALNAYKAVLSNYPSSDEAKDCQWRIDHIQRKHIDKKGWWE